MDLLEWPPKGNRRHPWETSRCRFFKGIIAIHINHRQLKIIDVGAGDGWFSREMLDLLHPDTTIVCWDSEYTIDKINRLSSVSDGRIKYTSVQPEEKFDFLILLDILEHIDDDTGFLSKVINENMNNNSLALISVPAWPKLFSRHDAHLKHIRRYSPKKCKVLLESCGLKIIIAGGLFHSLLLPRLLSKSLSLICNQQSKVKDIGDWKYGNIITRLIENALSVDNKISVYSSKLKLDLPGLSWWALCKKQ